MAANVKSWRQTTSFRKLLLYLCTSLCNGNQEQVLNQGTNSAWMQTGHQTEMFHTDPFESSKLGRGCHSLTFIQH